MLREHNDDFLPDDTSLEVIDIVDLVKYDELDVSDKIRSPVEHTSQNLGGHNQTARLGVDLNIAGQNADLVKFLSEISELLVTESLDG